MTKLLYKCQIDNLTTYTTECIYEMLHEVVSHIYSLKKHQKIITIYVVSETYMSPKKYPMIIDTMTIDDQFVLTYESDNESISLFDIAKLQQRLPLFTGYSVTAFYKLLNDIMKQNNPKKQSSKKSRQTSQPKPKQKSPVDLTDILSNLKSATENINEPSKIEPVFFPDELVSSDNSDNDDDSNDEFHKLTLRNDDDNDDYEDCSKDDNDNDNDMNDDEIKAEIEKLTKFKRSLDNTVNELKKSAEDEQINLSKYSSLVNTANNDIKKIKEKDENEYRIFISEKDFTYQKIYTNMFVKKYYTWSDVPSLFLTKFTVYLYMDGKDINGKDVRPKLLNTDDEFKIFTMLHSSIIDEDYECPDDENDKKIINDFLENLPPVTLISPADIMDAYNQCSDSVANTEIFKEEGTDQIEAVEKDDDEIELYSGPKGKMAGHQ